MDSKHISQSNLQTIWTLSMSYEVFHYNGKVNLQFEFPTPRLGEICTQEDKTDILLAETYQVDDDLSFLLIETTDAEYLAFDQWLNQKVNPKIKV